MKKLHTVLALAILSTSLMGGVALAQQDHHDNHNYVDTRNGREARSSSTKTGIAAIKSTTTNIT